jgi:hypothetical protein
MTIVVRPSHKVRSAFWIACSFRIERGRRSAWLRPRIAPLAIMVATVAGALSGRVFRLPGGIMPPARSSRWRIVDRRTFEEASGIVRVRPCGRGKDKGGKASADKHSYLRGGIEESFRNDSAACTRRATVGNGGRSKIQRSSGAEPAANAT